MRHCVAMKHKPTDDRLTLPKILARFGGRFLCRSPPAAGGGPPPPEGPVKGPGPIHGGGFPLRRLAGKSRWRRAVRHVLALLFCLMVALIVLADPLCATVLAAGFRLRRQRLDKSVAAMTATATPKEHTP